MADSKISALSSTSYTESADLLNVVQTATSSNKKITVGNFLSNIRVPTIIDGNSASASLTVRGTSDLNLLNVNSTSDKIGIGTSSLEDDAKVQIVGNIVQTEGYIRSSSVQAITSTGGAVTVNNTDYITNISMTSASANVTSQLSNGVQGQIKQLYMTGSAAAFKFILTPISAGGFVSIEFDALGDAVTLQYNNNAWYIMNKNNVNVVT